MRYPYRPWLTVLASAALLLPAGVASALPQQGAQEFSDSANELATYFGGGGIEMKDWADGPVAYIMLDYERDEWKKLESDEHRRQFMTWFWNRRDLDARDNQHEFRAGFYERVAYANQRFTGFPKGWRSDRGRVWITLGQPSGGMRPIDMTGWGRCSAQNGEQWIYYTNNMAFNAQFGEFQVVFVETRMGQYEICEPNMMGVGGWPVDVRRAMDMTNQAVVNDTATVFTPGRSAEGSASTAVAVRDAVAKTEPLDVPMAEWGDDGIGGAALVPFEIPLRNLLFEPAETTLVARLVVDARLVAMGTNSGPTVHHEWAVELGPDDAGAIAGGALRTAVVLPAAAGGYSAQVRVLEPISGTEWIWEGPVEVSETGTAMSPPLVAATAVQLDDDAAVAVLGRSTARVRQGQVFSIVSWVRGAVPALDQVRVTIFDADDNEVALEGVTATWGDAQNAGPLVVKAVAPAAVPGEYILRLEVGEQTPVETRIRIE